MATETTARPLVHSIVLAFPDSASAERVIAGLAVATRAVAEAAAAGIRDIRLTIGKGHLSPALAAELDRVRGEANVRVVPSDGSNRGMRVEADRVLLTRAAITGTEEPIDLRNGWAAARAILRGTAKAGDGLVSRWLNRPISQFISGVLLRIAPSTRPWHASMGAAATGVLMVLALLIGGKWGLIAGGLLFHAASVIDGVDGEIARATWRTSRAGAILDTTIDMITNLAFFICITVALTRLYGPAYILVGAWSVGWVALGVFAMRELAIRAGEPGNFNVLKRYYLRRFPTGIPALIARALVILTSRETFAFVFAVTIPIGLGPTTFYSLAGFVTLWVVLIAAAAPGLLRESRVAYEPASA